MRILTVVFFYIIGFVNLFGACYMMRRVFRWKIRNYLIFSLAGGALPMLYVLVPYLLGNERPSLNMNILAAVYIPLIWLFMTDRSLKSFAVSASGYAFVACTGNVLTIPANMIMIYLGKNNGSVFYIYLTMLLGEAAAVAFVIFIGKIGKSRLTEPMSIWNIVFIALLAFFTNGLTFTASPELAEDTTNSQTVTAILFSLLSLAFLSIAVVMTVKFTESRYYSTLNSINESYLNAQKDYYEMKQTSDTEIRRIRHDMKNHLICIRELASQKKYDELESYINDITKTVSDADRLIHTGNGIVDAIVNEKAALARKAGVKFEWEGTISGLEISAVDSCTLVANLLDNALEACDKVDVAKRFISLSFRRSEHFLLMTCENSAVRVIEMSDGRPLSTKGDKYNHGFGLENMIRCVEKYGGELKLSSEETQGEPIFTAQAIIPI